MTWRSAKDATNHWSPRSWFWRCSALSPSSSGWPGGWWL